MKLFLTLLGLFICVATFSQQYNFKNYSVEHGLAQSQVYDLLEDSYGNLWVGTDGGVSRFDGYKFTTFTKKDGLVSIRIRTIFEDSHNRLWFGTVDGISMYNGKTFTNFSVKDGLKSKVINDIIETKNGDLLFGTNKGIMIFKDNKFSIYKTHFEIQNIAITTLLQDSKGNYWFATKNNGLYYFDGKNYTHLDKTNTSFKTNSINHIYEDSDKQLWFVSDSVVCLLQDKKFKLILDASLLKDAAYQCIKQDNNHDFWIGTYGYGTIKYNPTTKTTKIYNANNGLSGNYIETIEIDTTGNVWFGTDGAGLSKFDSERFIHYTEKDGLAHNVVMAIMQDTEGNYWFGTYGYGVSKYDGNTFVNYTENDGLVSNVVVAIMQDRKNNIWFGTRNAGISIYNGNTYKTLNENNGLISNKVYSITEAFDGSIWISTDKGVCQYINGEIIPFTTTEGIGSNRIMTVFEDSKHNIWIGTDGSGLNKIVSNEKQNQLYRYTIENGLSNNSIFSINEDQNGNIWLGTFGGGLSKFDGEHFINYTTAQGLSSNNIYFLVFDNDNHLWIGSERGVDRTTIEKDSIIEVKHYGIAEGLIGLETNANAVLKDNNGDLWFGTINGVTKYKKNEDKTNEIEPRTYIRNVKLFYETVNWETLCDTIDENTHLPVHLELPNDKNHLTFEFIGIDLKVPEKVKYQWILEGFDKTWSPISNRREAIYSYIPPGKYTFKVKAANSDGIWNDNPYIFSFEIMPPFYLRWWFFVSLGILITGLVIGYIRYRVYALEREKRLLESRVKWKTRQLLIEKENIEMQREKLAAQAEQLENTNKELEKLSLVVRETGNAVIITDKNGDIEWVNEGFKRLYGYNVHQFATKFGYNIFNTSQNAEIKEMVKKAAIRKHSIMYEAPFIKKDDSVKWIQTSLTPIFDKKGVLKNLVLIETDISKLKDAQDKVNKQKELIEQEKDKTDKLLLNILPMETAQELKLKGQATARHYRLVSVMFTDFTGFTKVAAEMSPQQLVNELHKNFVKFDEIIENNRLEKIKTIGDAYMCAGGLPIRNKSNPIDIILAAFEIKQYIESYKTDALFSDKPKWELRIGIHTGPVVAGVVGKKKFAYDIWGDTVNTASRMESGSESNKINISGVTYKYIKDYFDCTHRGKIHAKHKGLVDMYFVDRIKAEFSADDKGFVPNIKFRNLLNEI